jgi:hypothetical protein
MDRETSMVAAYVVTALAYIVYAVSLWIRKRNLRRGPGPE